MANGRWYARADLEALLAQVADAYDQASILLTISSATEVTAVGGLRERYLTALAVSLAPLPPLQ